jgi:three-Cys-motif partner protein
LLNPKTAPQVHAFTADGLTVTASEAWFKVKVQVINKYLEAFTAQVAGRADEIIFVDLFAGSGLYAHGHQKEIFPGAGFASLNSGLPISRWILCERNSEQLEALRFRVQKYFSHLNVAIIDESATGLMDRLQDVVPAKTAHKVAVFCLIDPFSLDVPFSWIERLSSLGWNFLIPFTFPLNNHSDHRFYLEENQERVLRFVGHSADGLADAGNNWQFYQMLVRTYENNLLVTGMNTALSVHKLESHWLEVPAYYVGFFTRKISARAIQQEVQSLTHPQFTLF